MKTKLLIVLCIILTTLLFVQVVECNDELSKQKHIIETLQVQGVPQENRITLDGAYTLIRTTEDYIYLNSLEIDREQWESATKHTDINNITWYEIIEDGYIKCYAVGHVMPDSIHWYAPY